jgi:hypothetical protein
MWEVLHEREMAEGIKAMVDPEESDPDDIPF